MKTLVGIFILCFSFQASASDYFAELRLGVEDGYRKVVVNAAQNTLEGTFKKMNFGIRAGMNKGSLSYFLEYNPEQEVEVVSANELANVYSIYAGGRYNFSNGAYAGGVLGYASFELVQGPGGVTFTDNPTTDGMTAGFVGGYNYAFADTFYVGADLLVAFLPFKADGPSTTPVETIEIEFHYKANISLGMNF